LNLAASSFIVWQACLALCGDLLSHSYTLRLESEMLRNPSEEQRHDSTYDSTKHSKL
jgi:hypothetical protein